MIQLTASVIVLSADLSDSVSWDSILAGRTLIQHCIDNAKQIPVLDQIYVLTDNETLLRQKAVSGVQIKKIPEWLTNHHIDLISKDAWQVNYGLERLQELSVLGEVHFFLNWRMPLTGPITFEKMYHNLLEDRLAARVTGIYPVDPNLFMFHNSNHSLFPVWADPGADRQRVPQLFRQLPLGVIHTGRHKGICPESKGYVVTRTEGLVIYDAEYLDMAAFFLEDRMSGQ